MIDPKRMKRLWDACPELRPFQYSRAATEYGLWYITDYGNVEQPVTNEVFARLIFAENVIWLAKQGSDGDLFSVRISHQFETMYYVGRDHAGGIETDPTTGKACLFEGRKTTVCDPDPTIASILACERVLGLEPWEPANG